MSWSLIPAGVLLLLAVAGAQYMFAVAVVLHRYFAKAPECAARDAAVTLLKPLYGAEPRLEANLATFLAQQHAGPIQLLCGVASAADPAIAAVEALRRAHPDADIELVIDATRHGASGKISNLVNMAARAKHPVLVLSDSDIAVGPDYLAQVLGALEAPGVGAVTCFYHGRGDAGFWSRVAAAGLSWQFAPGAVFGAAMEMAKPCMGSTIALRRTTLDAIGGFARFGDVLADDHAIGAAVRALGLAVAIPPMLVTHGSDEPTLDALLRHELRWAATVRGLVSPASYLGSLITYPLPYALLALPFAPEEAAFVTLLVLVARLAVALTSDRISGRRTAPLWLLPLRDCLSFGVFVASFFARSVDWRGARLKMTGNGRMAAAETSPS
jgi:ceramide glucosyltransferase